MCFLQVLVSETEKILHLLYRHYNYIAPSIELHKQQHRKYEKPFSFLKKKTDIFVAPFGMFFCSLVPQWMWTRWLHLCRLMVDATNPQITISGWFCSSFVFQLVFFLFFLLIILIFINPLMPVYKMFIVYCFMCKKSLKRTIDILKVAHSLKF